MGRRATRVRSRPAAAERALRAVALGRKNWLFAGSDDGGERAAAIYSLVINEALGSKLNGSRADLLLIQKLLDAGTVEREATYTLQALGLAFGKVFIEENADYDWWMVQDEFGRDPAIRYKQSSLLAYPRTMISKRLEVGEPVNVTELFDGLCRKMEELIEKGWL